MTRKNEKPKKKLKGKHHTVRFRLTSVRHGTERGEQLHTELAKHSVLKQNQLATGIWQHPRTGLFQVWASIYGHDVTWISAHKDADRAQQDADEIKAAVRRGDVYDADKVAELTERLTQAGDAEPEDMPAEEIAKIIAYIQNMAVAAAGGQPDPDQPGEQLSLVMAELEPGQISVGWRLGQEDMIDVFAENLTPQAAARLVADITQGRIDMEELSRRPMREVHFPVAQDLTEPQPPQSPIEYRYTLPHDDAEVVVSGVAMAIIDIAKEIPLPDARAIQERALWHCEESLKHIRVGELTNDYEGFKQLFISNYTTIYERDPRELGGAVRNIINRHSMMDALIEIRNIVKGLYFPDLADLENLATEYQGILLTPRKSLDGYYVTFTWNDAVMRTPDLATPILALAQAQRMIDKEEKL